ncbi:hypothetical protein PVAND_006884 [Polypedilum vanderplanki]|uniref:Uncharacterized protein n=1 Tax=Polypedilum vanderplanki TaxID=319348 RepID=A0A9J6C5C3_POLVA|nr:hypothetical protein PVAND_006884 [Polypedilum vanderplanki]
MEELKCLQLEFQWILQKEVLLVLKQLHDILVECAHRFPVPLHGNEGKKVDKFILTSAPEQLKVVVTLTGDSITSAQLKDKISVFSQYKDFTVGNETTTALSY